jgi:hypothetical protein
MAFTGLTNEDIERARQVYAGVAQPVVTPMPAPVVAPVAPPVLAPPGAAVSPWKAPAGFDEAGFQRDIRVHPWFTEFTKRYGEEPNLNDPDYDYRSAWAAGIRPEIYKHDGTYHWSSSLPNGQMLKSENHPTAWMEHFMRATGTDPNDLGLKSKEEGDAYIARMKNTPPGKQVPASSSLASPPPAPRELMGESQAFAASKLPEREQELLNLPAPKPAQPAMNLGNWRQELVKGYDQNTSAQSGIASDQASQLEQANEGIRAIGAMHQAEVDASNERRRIGQEEWEAARPKLMEQVSQFDSMASSQVLRDRRNGMQKTMGAVALGLGQAVDQNNLVAGLMQGTPVYTHNADSIQQNLNATMDRDIELQRVNLANARDSADAARSQLGMARQFFMDDQAAEDFVRADLSEQYARNLDELAKTLTNDMARDRVLATAEQMRLEGTQGKAQVFAAWEQQKKAEAAARAAARAKGPDWSKFTPAELKAAIDAGAAPAGAVNYYNEVVAKGLKNDELVADVEQKRAATAKLEAEAANPKAANMSDGDKKLARLAEGVQPAVKFLSQYLGDGGKDIPYLGVAKTGYAKALQAVMPEFATPDDNLQFAGSVDALENVLLRDESGANLPDSEKESKRRTWNLGAGSHELRKEGLRRMLLEFDARRRNGTLPATIDAQPVAPGGPVADGR